MYLRRCLYRGASAMTLLCALVFVLEREVSERKCGEEDAMGFGGGEAVVFSPLLSVTGRGSGGAGW